MIEFALLPDMPYAFWKKLGSELVYITLLYPTHSKMLIMSPPPPSIIPYRSGSSADIIIRSASVCCDNIMPCT